MTASNLEPIETARDNEIVLSRTTTESYTRERFDIEQTLAAEKTKSIVIAPTKTADGIILVDWYTTDDPANPQNWPASRK